MKYRIRGKYLSAACLIGSSLLLAACGSSDDSSTSSAAPTATSSTVSGVAATGAAIAGGSIVLHCQNNWNEGTTTNSNGEWSILVPTANLPCAIKASNSGASESYYSFTVGSGSTIVTNVSPLTSLALANATGATVDDAWFNALNDSGRQALTTGLPAAITALGAALSAQSYALPASFNPFTATFTAAAGDDYDDLLEQLKAAIAASGTDFAALLADFAAGASLPAPADNTETPSGGATTASGSITSSNSSSPDFTPQSDGFGIEVDYESITYTFKTTRLVGSASYTHSITIETDVRKNITELTYVDGSRLGVSSSIVCGINYGKPCSGITITATPASKSVTVTFSDATLALRTGATLGADTIFNGSLTGTMPAAAAFSISDLPRATTGTPTINNISEAIISTKLGMSSSAIPNGIYTVTTIEMLTAEGSFTLSRNRTIPNTGTATEVRTLLYQKAGVAGGNSIYSCANTNCSGLTLLEEDGTLSIQLNAISFENYGSLPALTINGTITIGASSGSLTSSAEGIFTPADSSISSTDGVLEYRFNSIGNVSTDNILVVTVSVRGNVLSGVSVSAKGGKLYTCTENGEAFLGWPACGGSIVLSNGRRTLTLSEVNLNTGKYSGNLALTLSGTLTNQGL
ncbi:MAG: hypothetical protein ACRERR_01385 [Moraxellaceae bacterium]